MQQGSDLESAGHYEEALKAYDSAARIDDQYAELEFRIARRLWKLGKLRGREQHFHARSRPRHFAFSRRQPDQ